MEPTRDKTTTNSAAIKATEAPATTTTTTTTAASSDLVGTTCMELALEGERLCQTGDLRNGVRFFEEAIKVGTNDDRTLSAIYSQLGNAYFYLEDYHKALEFHKQDVTLVHSIGDEAAEAKACGNLGNTYKMLARFDEAAVYCRRYLEISRKLQDDVGEGRALYNLGNVYHMQGKRMIGTSEQESGELPNDIKSSLQRAVEYYEANLKVVTKLNDSVAMGRAYGNLGNTHYLLGNFKAAVESHKRRLELAKQTNDKSAERRAHLNLGNANVFLGNFPEAIENYSATLKLAQELNDKHTEAHSCYSLANTYTFLRDYHPAIENHLRYLSLIRELEDKLGEGRACWSLVNIYQMVNDPESALTYAKKHYEIAELLGDETGLASARANIEELEETINQKLAVQAACASNSSAQQQHHHQLQQHQQKDAPYAGPASHVGLPQAAHSGTGNNSHHAHHQAAGGTSSKFNSDAFVRLSPDKRQEQEQRRFKKQLNSNLATDIDGLATRRKGRGDRGAVRSSSSERLFDMIAHFQSGRIDDQRCEILIRPIAAGTLTGAVTAANEQTTKSRGLCADDKENLAANNTNECSANGNVSSNSGAQRASQSSITNPLNVVSAATSAIKATYRKASLVAYPTQQSHVPSIQSQRRPTVSAEHRDQLFDLIAGAQNQRMDEQRASLPALTLANGILRNPTSANLLGRGRTVDHSSTTLKPKYPNDSQANPTTMANKPEPILEQEMFKPKQRSQSIAPAQIPCHTPPTITSETTQAADIANRTSSSRSRINKLSRHFQTLDSDAQLHDEKFLDSLMRYQSTRFDDQRSEFPNVNNNNNETRDNSSEGRVDNEDATNKGQNDQFFNLIVRFQSDRIDDQRSAPPPAVGAANKNL